MARSSKRRDCIEIPNAPPVTASQRNTPAELSENDRNGQATVQCHSDCTALVTRTAIEICRTSLRESVYVCGAPRK